MTLLRGPGLPWGSYMGGVIQGVKKILGPVAEISYIGCDISGVVCTFAGPSIFREKSRKLWNLLAKKVKV